MIYALLLLTVAVLSFFLQRQIKKTKHVYNQFKLSSDMNILTSVENQKLSVFQKVIQNSPDLFIIVDQSLQVVTANTAASEYGWTSSHLFSDAEVADTCKLHFDSEIKNVLKTGSTTDGEIRLVKTTNDEWKFYMYHIFPIRDESDTVIGATLTAIDITAQRSAEIKLHQQSEFIQGVMDAIPDPIYVKSSEYKWIYSNQAFSKLVGKSLNELTSKNDFEIFDHQVAQLIRAYDEEAVNAGHPIEIEESLKFNNNQTMTSLSKRTTFKFQDGRQVIVAILRDISQRKQLESELQTSRARQTEAARLATLGETAGGIAHEINNPLNVIVGLAELMKATVEKKGSIEKEKLNDYCDRLVKYSMRIAKIIKGLRSISRDASRDPFADVELKTIIEETIEFSHQQFITRGIKLDFRFPMEPIVVYGRYAQVSQVVMNLINNARDALDGLSEATVFIEILEQNSMGIIRVWDSGAGVSPEIEEKLMTPFFTTKPAGKGTGLGLSISKSIAIEHKGHLILNRNISNSCFELQIPLAEKIQQNSAA